MLEFAALLRQHRLAAGLSQEELARQAGLSGDAVAALERGRRRNPRPLTVRLLTQALELTADERMAFIAAARGHPPPDSAPVQRAPVFTAMLIGREAELKDNLRLLTRSDTRLLTLTGAGGIGKTRLAIEVSAAAEHAFADGVRWASLGGCTDEATLCATVAATLGSTTLADLGPETLAEYLDDRALLLVLDGCEHIVGATARLCATLLRLCPRLAVLATSREVLRVPGEKVRVVPPLTEAESAHMFTSLAASYGARPGDADMGHVTRLCRRLDGLPLAVELAAARVNVLTPEQLVTEVEGSFRILSSANRLAPARQRSLDASVRWSYDLLTADEQRFFAVVSVFTGGWTMAAAQTVAAGAFPRASSSLVLDMTARLVDTSLITVDRSGGAARYDMFAFVREFAASRLDRTGLRDDLEHRHLAYYLRWSVRAQSELDSPAAESWLASIDAEVGNLRSAWRRATALRRRADATRLARTIAAYYRLRGRELEWRTWDKRAHSSHP
ncbi:ATP-binding protein [Phytoactinopolyspora halotolerans]|uniref:Helix-turn-helix domain-containing protein n=1 Tax=Phytoactinopolyspora halotolerans TaxID=1981512 RepID=A0A6L9SJM2_9ACTN|nr:helix-turn-helix domain-containing protein [Phytoactinopolyspora halotolerans]NEE04280.1 helix-turn-helix domain-containing protein [Phytoactinopolyspora halotolerans]